MTWQKFGNSEQTAVVGLTPGTRVRLRYLLTSLNTQGPTIAARWSDREEDVSIEGD